MDTMKNIEQKFRQTVINKYTEYKEQLINLVNDYGRSVNYATGNFYTEILQQLNDINVDDLEWAVVGFICAVGNFLGRKEYCAKTEEQKIIFNKVEELNYKIKHCILD